MEQIYDHVLNENKKDHIRSAKEMKRISQNNSQDVNFFLIF